MTTLPFILEHIKIRYVAVAPVTGSTSGKIKNICTKCTFPILTGIVQLLGVSEFLLSSSRGMFSVLLMSSKDAEGYFMFLQRSTSVLRQRGSIRWWQLSNVKLQAAGTIWNFKYTSPLYLRTLVCSSRTTCWWGGEHRRFICPPTHLE